MFDIAIIGAGPAGASAAIFTAKAGKKTLLIDGDKSMTKRAWIENHYGLAEVTGPDLVDTGKKQAVKLGNTVTAGIAAGLSRQDAEKLVNSLQLRSRQMNHNELCLLAEETMLTARDLSRQGVSSATTAEVVGKAVQKGFAAGEMHTMRSTFSRQEAHGNRESLARNYGTAIDHGVQAHDLQGHGTESRGFGGTHSSGDEAGSGAGKEGTGSGDSGHGDSSGGSDGSGSSGDSGDGGNSGDSGSSGGSDGSGGGNSGDSEGSNGSGGSGGDSSGGSGESGNGGHH